ncbi:MULTISPECIES: outer membrane protein transport protein [unclassified Limnobacter]|jgi:long-chain fatty acid transport protein|uniref:OmpP1/FadL family transporter n=2 Tax=Limnobacter TaxID=131079 RepID=UPI0012F2BD46|nr:MULTISPECIES: outer membrane protein transport protein [unclassified Limnobacter]VWX35050.1 Long-chain fatty acid transporter [Limnobacter sp. 130]
MVFFQQSSLRRACAVAFSVMAFSLSHQTFAGGTANDNQSAMGIATAGAGQAAEASDASVIFFNPAALTRFKRIEVLNVASIATFDNDYTSRQNNDGPPTDNGREGSAGEFFSRKDGTDSALFIPGLFVAIPVSPKLVVGFSASGSHGLLTRYREDFPGRGAGRESDLKITRLNLGFGYKLTPTLSIGANGSYERYFQSIKIRLNYRDAVSKLGPPGTTALLDTLNASGLAPPIPGETDAKLRILGWALNAQAGLLWEPTDRTRIGASYRPKTRFNGNQGELTINENADTAAFREFLNGGLIAIGGPLLGVNGPQAAGDLEPQQQARQRTIFPDEFRISLFHHYSPKLDLMATYTYQDYTETFLRYERVSNGRVIEDLPQDFKVAQAYRIGLNYKPYKRLTLHAGYGMENGVVGDDLRVPILPDNDRRFYGLGASFTPSRDTTVTLAFGIIDVDAGQVGNNTQVTPIEVSGGEFKGIADLDAEFFSLGFTQRF